MLLQPLPPGFKDHTHRFQVKIPHPTEDVWKWLNDPKTFTKTQVWPFKVEFYSPNPGSIPNGFHEGVLTNHTGPFINFAGKLMSIKEDYRDLQYFYGSYAIAFNWARPYRLEFWTKEEGEETILTCALSTYVKPGLYRIWAFSQNLFWGRFKRWATRNVRKVSQNK